MREIVLIKNGELALKGLNRSSFEDVLIKNMRRHLAPLGTFQFTKSQSTIMVEPEDSAATQRCRAAVVAADALRSSQTLSQPPERRYASTVEHAECTRHSSITRCCA